MYIIMYMYISIKYCHIMSVYYKIVMIKLFHNTVVLSSLIFSHLEYFNCPRKCVLNNIGFL